MVDAGSPPQLLPQQSMLQRGRSKQVSERAVANFEIAQHLTARARMEAPLRERATGAVPTPALTSACELRRGDGACAVQVARAPWALLTRVAHAQARAPSTRRTPPRSTARPTRSGSRARAPSRSRRRRAARTRRAAACARRLRPRAWSQRRRRRSRWMTRPPQDRLVRLCARFPLLRVPLTRPSLHQSRPRPRRRTPPHRRRRRRLRPLRRRCLSLRRLPR